MKDISKIKKARKGRRVARIRVRVFGTEERPRLAVSRSLRGIYVQIINDKKGETLVAANTKEVQGKNLNKTKQAFELGKLIAKKAIESNIKTVVFDRAGNKFHGRIKAVADGAKEGGLKI